MSALFGLKKDISLILDPKRKMYYFKWIDEEDVLFTWLLDSMKPEISDLFIDHEFVKDIWDEVIRLYSKVEDELRMTDLNKKAMEFLQEQQSVLEYSN